MNNNALVMEISSDEVSSEVAVLKITGFLDFSGIAMLSGFFGKITAENKNYLIVDLAGVEMICSAALGEFMGYRKKLADKGGNLVFAGLAGAIRSKLTLLGANKIFSFYHDVRGAINAYKWDYKKQSKSITVSFPPFLKLVPPVRQLVSRLARQNGYSTKDAFRIETIVDEVCNNAVEHGLGDPGSEIVLRLSIDKEKVELNVTNQSDPEKISTLRELIKPAVQSDHVGDDDKRGRGLALIRMLSNNMDVKITERGTSVHVVKLREEQQ
ncbi:MAG: ATP-binding protein [Chitinispirillales bacterium]|jgi:anti-sigma regulatory factor (Ser/Thr protein kinase)/anti-anti-sigma regulatory factor|nr:ATP-binding protein [Chitinispirillales bacterium]